MQIRARKVLLLITVAVITSLTLGPLGSFPAAAQTVSGTAMSVTRAEQIAKAQTYIPEGYALSSESYNAAQNGQPAQYNLNYVQGTSQNQNQQMAVNVSVNATTGMILNYYRQSDMVGFQFPATVSQSQAQTIAFAWAKRLYGPYTTEVAQLQQQPSSGPLTTPIQYTYTFERIVHGVPAPFDGFSITISASGHLLQANANWTPLAFPAAQPKVTMSQANSIYRKSLHFHLVYGQNWSNAVDPTTMLDYVVPERSYPDDFNTQFSNAQSVNVPVIDAATGTVIDSDGVEHPLPTYTTLKMLVPNGPAHFPGLIKVNWNEAQCRSYAMRVLELKSSDKVVNDSESTQQGPSGDVTWNFTWDISDHRQINASVDATRGVLTSFNENRQNMQPLNVNQSAKITDAQALARVNEFVKRVFPDDIGGIAVTTSPFQKFPNGFRRFFELEFYYRGVEVQGSEGNVSVSGNSGQVSSFNWQPSAGLTKLPSPDRAVSLATVVHTWMQAEPLTLQYVLTQPQLDYKEQQSQAHLPAPRIVLTYAPTGPYGYGVGVNALTGALQNQGQNPVPYTGTIHGLEGMKEAPYILLLVNHELLPVDPSGDVHPRRVMTRAQWVKLVVDTLGLDNPVTLPESMAPGMQIALTGIPATAPDYAELVSAYTRNWIIQDHPLMPNVPVTRSYAAQVLVKALGYGPILADDSAFRLTATDAKTIPDSQYAGDAIAVALKLLTLQDGRFNGGSGLTVAEAAKAVVQMANVYAAGAQNDQQPSGNMMG